ncbi:hypothetical protein AERO8C_160180 [Aeromonas veronii]|uniref:Uncharacterized protein n=1 Tax=Aeromonas veronii TaxID=654 RepID=A0A653KY19_AERVE|nr:hypothetical protein AERO8C_160180 [Aeromonas veronii]
MNGRYDPAGPRCADVELGRHVSADGPLRSGVNPLCHVLNDAHASPLNQCQRHESGQCVECQNGESGGLLFGHAINPSTIPRMSR